MAFAVAAAVVYQGNLMLYHRFLLLYHYYAGISNAINQSNLRNFAAYIINYLIYTQAEVFLSDIKNPKGKT